ncbi:MAG: hypothetical protein MJ113_00490 [Lachnospiraceae bacterium]|nr:hypothetical protein [Lachnospiraceae bacterium]
MTIGGYGSSYYVSPYMTGATLGATKTALTNGLNPSNQVNPVGRVNGVLDVANVRTAKAVGTEMKAKKECQTCKERKYVDKSNEGNVSFKSATHISPESAAGAVMRHENEHVANAVKEGNEDGKKLISATVSLKMAICPECGRSYIAGGVTKTKMQIENPLAKKAFDAYFPDEAFKGDNFDSVA